MTKPTRYGHLIEHWQAARREMTEILIRQAQVCEPITYGALSDLVQTVHIPAGSYAMSGMLDEIARENKALGKETLATLVVSKATGRPGVGYFRKGLYSATDVPNDLHEDYWLTRLQKVCEDWQEG